MPSLIAPYTLPSENTTEGQLYQNFSQMYILMGKVLYRRNECCNNQLKTIFFPDNSFFQVHSHFSRIFNKIIKFQYFSRTGKTVVIFPGAVGTLQTAPPFMIHQPMIICSTIPVIFQFLVSKKVYLQMFFFLFVLFRSIVMIFLNIICYFIIFIFTLSICAIDNLLEFYPKFIFNTKVNSEICPLFLCFISKYSIHLT